MLAHMRVHAYEFREKFACKAAAIHFIRSTWKKYTLRNYFCKSQTGDPINGELVKKSLNTHRTSTALNEQLSPRLVSSVGRAWDS